MTGSTPTTMPMSTPAPATTSSRTYSHATVSAGDGDDHVLTSDHSVVDAGAGDDAIQVGGSSTVTGGAGNDHIRVTGDDTTINFAKGDGNDVVRIDNGSVASISRSVAIR